MLILYHCNVKHDLYIYVSNILNFSKLITIAWSKIGSSSDFFKVLSSYILYVYTLNNFYRIQLKYLGLYIRWRLLWKNSGGVQKLWLRGCVLFLACMKYWYRHGGRGRIQCTLYRLLTHQSTIRFSWTHLVILIKFFSLIFLIWMKIM